MKPGRGRGSEQRQLKLQSQLELRLPAFPHSLPLFLSLSLSYSVAPSHSVCSWLAAAAAAFLLLAQQNIFVSLHFVGTLFIFNIFICLLQIGGLLLLLLFCCPPLFICLWLSLGKSLHYNVFQLSAARSEKRPKNADAFALKLSGSPSKLEFSAILLLFS